jgi:hypothetical protein
MSGDWCAAILLDGEPNPFVLVRRGVVHAVDGQIVRFANDLEASRLGLSLALAERRAAQEAEK